jgi:hypothetical protein
MRITLQELKDSYLKIPIENWRDNVYHLHYMTYKSDRMARSKSIEFENDIKKENDNRFKQHKRKIPRVS